MLKLKELKAMVPETGKMDRVPTYKKLREFWDRATQGGRKSFRYDELEASFQISTYDGVMLHYLEMINHDLQMRD